VQVRARGGAGKGTRGRGGGRGTVAHGRRDRVHDAVGPRPARPPTVAHAPRARPFVRADSGASADGQVSASGIFGHLVQPVAGGARLGRRAGAGESRVGPVGILEGIGVS